MSLPIAEIELCRITFSLSHYIFQVWIGSGDDWSECGTIDYDGSSIISVPCGASGDKIAVTNDNNYLTLCEVQVITVEEENPSEEMDEE